MVITAIESTTVDRLLNLERYASITYKSVSALEKNNDKQMKIIIGLLAFPWIYKLTNYGYWYCKRKYYTKEDRLHDVEY